MIIKFYLLCVIFSGSPDLTLKTCLVKPTIYKALDNVVEADETECSGEKKVEKFAEEITVLFQNNRETSYINRH